VVSLQNKEVRDGELYTTTEMLEVKAIGTYDFASPVELGKSIDLAMRHYFSADDWLAVRVGYSRRIISLLSHSKTALTLSIRHDCIHRASLRHRIFSGILGHPRTPGLSKHPLIKPYYHDNF
jgi:hypothetical protein